MIPDDVLKLVEGAPDWVKWTVAVLAIVTPLLLVLVPRILPDRLPLVARTEAPEDEEDQDARELRDALISVLSKLQKAETNVEALQASLAVKDDELRRKDEELRREQAQAAALTSDLSQLRGEVTRLQGLLELVIQQRGSTPPPTRP